MPRQQLNSYQDVQAFFNDFIAANQIDIDSSPHGAFWNTLTYDQFVNGNVPGVAGSVRILVSGNSADSNLVKILKGPLTVNGRTFRRMPGGGPFMTDDMIASLADWIDRGCPNPPGNSGRRPKGRRPSEQGSGESKSAPAMESQVHVIRPGVICDTDARGHETPRGMSPLELVLDATNGFIPLWQPNMTLRWRFRERSLRDDAEPLKNTIRGLLAEALVAWGAAAPITFTYDEDLWDFEIVVQGGDQCNAFGCVLASAFFPDSGRHELRVYPKMFTQSRKEQVDTLIHEIGHVFGLRHFFAQVRETAFPSVIFGRHEKFSIMNYGEFSELTSTDKEDLVLLYELVWSGELTQINGTPIRLFKPYSAFVPGPVSAAVYGQGLPVFQPQAAAVLQQPAPARFGSPSARSQLLAAAHYRSRAAYLSGE